MDLYDNLREEKRSAYLYTIIAMHDDNVLHKKLFTELAAAAEKQAHKWEVKIASANLPLARPYQPDLRTRLVARLIKHIPLNHLQFILSAMKIRGMAVISQPHNEHRHTRFTTTSNLRAAVFGINDGLISNVSLILGMYGANASPHFIIVAGIAGLLAGACSMGAGEYVSVRSQREVLEHQIEIEKQELQFYPEEEKEELSLIYQARGVPEKDAVHLANLLINNPETALATLVREELGLNPNELVSPIGAMVYSFLFFALGALIPLIPFLLGNQQWNLYASISLTLITLFVIGTILSLFTHRHPIWLGLRMMGIGILAGGMTFLIGKCLQVGMT